jgi:DNA-binding response OmpR family regulator
MVDRDSGFLTVLRRRSAALGWDQRDLTSVPAVDALVSMRLHALVIDISLLGPQWVDVIDYLRANLPGLAVIVCTGPSSVGQRVRGLRAGVDDWMTKPCHPEELIARIESVLRRSRKSETLAREPLVVGDIAIRPDQFQVFHDGRSIDLTRREFELLQLLAENADTVIEREDIYQRVWGYRMAHGDRSVDVFVRKLRHKLAQASPDWDYIHTHFGVGYRFAPQPADAGPESPPAKSAAEGKPAAKRPAKKSGAKAKTAA